MNYLSFSDSIYDKIIIFVTTKSIFSRNFKYFRKKAGFDQEGIAQKLEVSKRTISLYESSKGYPKVDLLEKMSEVLKVPVEYFFVKDPEAQISSTATEGLSTDTLQKLQEYKSILEKFRGSKKGQIPELLETLESIIKDLEKEHLQKVEIESKLRYATDIIRKSLSKD